MMYLIDTACVTVAMGGTAFGASPFPEIARGKFTLFFLWITALKEVNTLVGLLLSTYYKKAYKQVGIAVSVILGFISSFVVKVVSV